MYLNSERIRLNLFQTWFKLVITTMINLRLHEVDNRLLQHLDPKAKPVE
jgi:hypothetical protein